MIATLVLALRFGLAIALYAFLGWAFLTVWQELRQQGKLLSAQKKPGILLGVRSQQGKESQNYFSQTEIIVGRDRNCDVSILDEALSAQHARIAFHHSQWWLEDLNSTNGIFLNGQKLTMPVVLTADDEFRCGNTLFRVRIEAGEKASTAKEN